MTYENYLPSVNSYIDQVFEANTFTDLRFVQIQNVYERLRSFIEQHSSLIFETEDQIDFHLLMYGSTVNGLS